MQSLNCFLTLIFFTFFTLNKKVTHIENVSFSGVIHFAGLKAVGESVSKPLKYWDTNVNGTLNVLEFARKHNIQVIYAFWHTCHIYFCCFFFRNN